MVYELNLNKTAYTKDSKFLHFLQIINAKPGLSSEGCYIRKKGLI